MKRHVHFIWLIALCFVGVTPVLATPQVGSRLELNGANHYVHGFDLRNDMRETFRKQYDKLPVISSANWKGYYVELEVRKKKLYLTRLYIDRPEGLAGILIRGPSIKSLFGITVPEDGVFADWFSGELKQWLGEEILSYTGVTEHVRVFRFENGILKHVEICESDYAKELRERKESE